MTDTSLLPTKHRKPNLSTRMIEWLSALPIDLGSLTQWLVTAAAFVLILSWGIERSKWFQSLTPEWKYWTVFIACFLVPIIGYLFQVLLWVIDKTAFPPPSLPIGEPIAVWLNTVYAFILKQLAVFFGTQWAHAKDPTTALGKPKVLMLP